MSFVRINGVLLHYRTAGPTGSPAVVLVNSLGTDLRIWDAVVASLSQRYRVLAYDKRGHGLSDAPSGDYGIEDQVADLAGLLDHAGIGDLALAGVSIGGLIAQAFALRYPRRLRALVLCDTAPRLGEPAIWNGRVETIRRGGLIAIADAVMERWFSERFLRDQPDDLAGWRNLFLRTDPEGYCRTCATLRDTDLTASVGGITTPTLVVAGSMDKSTPPDMVRACAAAIPGARFELIEGSGHLPSIERPAELTALMTSFFEEAGHG